MASNSNCNGVFMEPPLQVLEENAASLEKLNILILGVDSMSQQNFARMMKKTSSWLKVLIIKAIFIC